MYYTDHQIFTRLNYFSSSWWLKDYNKTVLNAACFKNLFLLTCFLIHVELIQRYLLSLITSLETKTDHDNIAKIIHGGDAFLSLFPFSSGGFHHLNLSSFRTSIVDMAKKLTADIRIFNETGG